MVGLEVPPFSSHISLLTLFGRNYLHQLRLSWARLSRQDGAWFACLDQARENVPISLNLLACEFTVVAWIAT